MSSLTNALTSLKKANRKEAAKAAPFRAVVTGTSGNLTNIRRLNATTPDSEPYAKIAIDPIAVGDTVLCMVLNGKPVILGKVYNSHTSAPPSIGGGSGGGAVDSVNGKTGVVTLNADDISDTATTHKFVTAADVTKLGNLSGTNTGDQDLSGYALSSSLALVAISGSYNDLTGKPSLFSGAYGDLTGVPSTFAPSPHTHTYASITSKPSTFAPSPHTHPVADITATGTPGTTTYLRGDGTWTTPPNTNTTYAEITTAEIDAGTATTLRTMSGRRSQYIVDKARSGVALASSLALVATSGSYTDLTNKPALFSGAYADLTGKPSTFAPSPHTHPVTDLQTTGTRDGTKFLRDDGQWSAPSAPVASVAWGAVTGTLANQLDLQAALDGKIDDGATLDAIADSATYKRMTSAERTKLSGIATGAEVNVQSDWNAASGDAHILNKPTLGTAAAASVNDFAVKAKEGRISEVFGNTDGSTNTGLIEDDVYRLYFQGGLKALTSFAGNAVVEVAYGGTGSAATVARSDHAYSKAEVDELLSWQPIPFTAIVAKNRASTTEITNFVAVPTIAPNAVIVPAGTYRVQATAMVSGRRSADTGIIDSRLVIGGVAGATEARAVDAATPGTNAQVAHFDDTITTTGTVSLSFEFKGRTTAATTYIYKGVLNGTLTRIG